MDNSTYLMEDGYGHALIQNNSREISLDGAVHTADKGAYQYSGESSYPYTATMQNITEPDHQSPKRNEDLAKIEIAVQAVIFVLAVIGNGTVISVIGFRKRNLSRMNLLIVHLSIADIFVAFFNVLPQLIWDITFRFYGNDFLCRFVKYVQVLGMYASSYVLVTTAIDRYLAICHPLTTHGWTNKTVHLLVTAAWACSMVFSLPQVFIFAYVEVQPGIYDCWGTFHPEWTLQVYITWITVAIYIIPFCILTLAYGRICFQVRKSFQFNESFLALRQSGPSRTLSRNGTSTRVYRKVLSTEESTASPSSVRAHSRGRSITKSKVKTVKLTLTVIICYMVCWAPFFVSQMWAAWDAEAPFEEHAMVIIMLLASLNSCTNPWIYLAFSDTLCSHVARCFCRRPKSKLRRPGTWDSSSRFKSSMISRSDVTRVDSLYGKSIPLIRLDERSEPKLHVHHANNELALST